MKLSIITINFNNCEGLRKTIESVSNQSFKDYEFIIIDGGSTDGSVELIKEQTNYITYWVSEKDNGIYHAMNKGIRQSHGDYFHNSDTLKDVAPLLSVDIVMGKAISDSGQLFGPHSPVSLYNICIYGFNHQATFYKRTLFQNHIYDEKLKFISDFKLTIENLIIDNCSYAIIDNIIVNYDLTGISSIHSEERNNERHIVLDQLFPKRLAQDYEFFSRLRSPMLEDILYLSSKYRFHNFIAKLVHLAVYFHKYLNNKNLQKPYENNM